MALAIQYASVLVHVRKWKSPRVPLGVMVLLHVVTGFIYLGVAFGFTDGNGKLYLSWYVITAVETSLNIAFSLTWQTLSFDGTHLAHRMSLLTYFLMGEGVLTVLSSVARVVVNGNAWSKLRPDHRNLPLDYLGTLSLTLASQLPQLLATSPLELPRSTSSTRYTTTGDRSGDSSLAGNWSGRSFISLSTSP